MRYRVKQFFVLKNKNFWQLKVFQRKMRFCEISSDILFPKNKNRTRRFLWKVTAGSENAFALNFGRKLHHVSGSFILAKTQSNFNASLSF